MAALWEDFVERYQLRKAGESAAKLAHFEMSGEIVKPPKFIAAADTSEVMREQLDYLIEHVASGKCGCSDCRRYSAARAVLVEPFSERIGQSLAWSAKGK